MKQGFYRNYLNRRWHLWLFIINTKDVCCTCEEMLCINFIQLLLCKSVEHNECLKTFSFTFIKCFLLPGSGVTSPYLIPSVIVILDQLATHKLKPSSLIKFLAIFHANKSWLLTLKHICCLCHLLCWWHKTEQMITYSTS